MQKHFRSSGRYTNEEVINLCVLVKIYVESTDPNELAVNKQALLNQLQSEERGYIIKNQEKREDRLVSYYTKSLPNFGARTTQITEGYNALIHKVCHH